MNILFLTTVLPSGRYGGGEIWSQNVVDALRSAGAEVTVLGYDRRGTGPGSGEIAVGHRIVETARNRAAALRWGVRAMLRSRPYTVEKWIGAEYRAAIRASLALQQWDSVIIDHAGMAWAINEIGNLPFVHLSHQAESILYRQHAAGRSILGPVHRREASLLRKTESRLTCEAAQTWTLSEDDAEYFQSLGGSSVRALPVAAHPDWEAATFTSVEGPDVALLGSWTWQPNRKGLMWFLVEVVPLLPMTWQIEVAGKYVANGLPSPENVRFVGVVDDAFSFLRRAQRIAVPSFSSVGVPIKLLDAIAAGPPVVATHSALERIGEAPLHVAAANDAHGFARALMDAKSAGSGADWTRTRQQALRESVAAAMASLR